MPHPPLKNKEPFPFDLYLPAGAGPFPLICITPILGRLGFLEDMILERYFGRFFSSHGFAAAVVERPFFEFNPSQGIEQIQRYLDDSVARNHAVLDRILERSDIDRERLGSFGSSFGAIVSCLWASREKRLKAHVFSLVGGNLPEIFVTSRDPLMRYYMKTILKGTGLNRDEFKTEFRKTLRLDPLDAASSLSREEVFLILGRFDHVIWPRYGRALWEALRRPSVLWVPLGHYPTILAIPFLKWKVLEFFLRRFHLRETRAATFSKS